MIASFFSYESLNYLNGVGNGGDMKKRSLPGVVGGSNLDLGRERRGQRYLLLICLVYFLCLLPLNVLK